MSVLEHASRQWSSRPADQRFSSLAALHKAVTDYKGISIEAPNTDVRALIVKEVESEDGRSTEPAIVGKSGVPARFTHYAFGQFSRAVDAPAAYLRTLPTELVVRNLNHGLRALPEGERANDTLLLAKNGGLRLRAMTSDKYTRIWNSDITSRLIALTEQSPEWQPAPAAFDGSRGLYASDRDLFCFMVDNERRIFEKDKNGGLGRGFFVSNSEVGDASFSVTTFMYEYVCGNHRVWGAKGVFELRIPHVGNADSRAFRKLSMELRKYADSAASADEAKIERAMTFELGGTKDEVLDKVFGLRIPNLPRKTIEASYALAEKREDWYGNPRSAWGLSGGMTEIARDLPNADERVALDKAAGRVMQIAF